MDDKEKKNSLKNVKEICRQVKRLNKLSESEGESMSSSKSKYASTSESSDDEDKADLIDRNLISAESSEDWMKLELGKEYEVFVCNFGSCSSFFVQVINENDSWDEMMSKLDDMTQLEVMQDIKVGRMCLVESPRGEDINRAKIIRHGEKSTMCFCVDTAEIVYFHNEPPLIFEIPEDIVSMMPFQAVNCCLKGVKVPNNHVLTDLIYKKIVRRICKQLVRPLRQLDHNPDMITWGLEQVQSYEVELFSRDEDGIKGSTVNDLVVEYQLADKI